MRCSARPDRRTDSQAPATRELKPIVADMVEGYGAEYLGVLESKSDGLGVWSADAFTLVTCVGAHPREVCRRRD